MAHFLGQTIEATWEVTEFEASRKQAVRSTSGPTPFEFVNTFESVEGGTKVIGTSQVKSGALFKLAELVLARMAERQQDTNWTNLKELLEAQGQ